MENTIAIKNLKVWLKQRAVEIKEAKVALKEFQRNGKTWDAATLQFRIPHLKYEFRHHFIAYCLLRGRTLDVIEKPRESNSPDHSYIERIIQDFKGGTDVAS